MNLRNERDEWLMVQVREGKRDCLEPLVRRYASPLLTFIHRMIGNLHLAEELFQDVFLAIWEKRQLYEFPRPFKPWLYAIALNKCRAFFRKSGTDENTWVGEAVLAPDASPADALVATETATIVAQAVTLLPVMQRTVVVMRMWEGMSYEEIALALERTETTIRSNMHHGLAALRKYLEPRLAAG